MLPFYFEVARTAFRRQIVYRWTNFAGLVTNIFFGILFSSVIIALYHARPLAGGYDVKDGLRYTWIVQSLLMVVAPFVWDDLLMTIRTGEVVSDLSKPCDWYWYWFSRKCGQSLYYICYRAIPIYLIGALIYHLGLPVTWEPWLAFGVTLTFGIMLGIAYCLLYSLAAFWIIEARAVALWALIVSLYFAGSYIPLYLMPHWLYAIAVWLPFHGFMNLPALAFMGKLSGSALWFEIARQIGWFIALTLIVRAISAVATRRVITQGG